jgi:GTPase SAR1 family protein
MVALQVWDTTSLVLYENSHALVLVFDLSNRASFEALDDYWKDFVANANLEDPQDFPCILVGNKIDLLTLPEQRVVDPTEIASWCATKRPEDPITYVEVAATNVETIQQLFTTLGREIYDFATVEPDTPVHDYDPTDLPSDDTPSREGTAFNDNRQEHFSRAKYLPTPCSGCYGLFSCFVLSSNFQRSTSTTSTPIRASAGNVEVA